MKNTYSVTEVYKKKWLVTPDPEAFKVSVPGMGGTLLIVTPVGTEAAQCVV